MDSSWVVDAADRGLRLDKYLAASDRLGSRSKAQDALGRGKVFLNGVEAQPPDAARLLAVGDAVRVWIDRPGSAKRRLGAFVDGDLRIVFEDDDLIVVDKPAGLLAVPLDGQPESVSVADLIERHWRSKGRRKPLVVHRIDRDTSGLVVFAVHARAQARLKEQFKRREPERVYWAVLYGCPDQPQGEWRDRLVWNEAALVQKRARVNDPRAVEAVLHYRVVETFGDTSLVEIRLDTGKQNQIRAQAQLHGHPLVGERRYVDDSVDDGLDQASVRIGRQALHALRLAFEHPSDGRPVEFEAPVPDDMRTLINKLRALMAERRPPKVVGRRP